MLAGVDAVFLVRWRDTGGARERSVEYATYSQAEACFISLLSLVDRGKGGWAELVDEGRVLLRLGHSLPAGDDGEETDH